MKPLLDWLLPWARQGQADDLLAAYSRAFSGNRAVLADLAVLCHAWAETYVPGDAQGTAFNEGRRAVWLHIMRMLECSPEDLQTVKDMLHHERSAYGHGPSDRHDAP